ncbi:MAG: hypothetical protein ACREQ9_20470 [Candidatus Binatia bacterium]
MRCRTRPEREAGFVLATIVVFVVVLSLTGFLIAALTRTDVQVVNNIRNETEAFYLAEAGVTEALVRLEMADPTLVTVDGLSFNVAIVPDDGDPAWTGQVLFTAAPPATSGSTFTTPTLQPAASRLAYSSTTPSEAVTLWWEPGPGGIRQVNGLNVLNVAATGRSDAARRRVRVQVTEDAGSGAVLLEPTGCSSLDLQGQADVSFASGIMVNSSCTTGSQALDLGPNTSLTASGIDVNGGYDGQGTVSPAPNTGVPPIPDPLAALPAPAAAPCTSNNLAITGNAPTLLTPGVYCGGIRLGGNGTTTFSPGLYVIAGGALDVSGNGSILGAGVTFYVTSHPTTGQWGSVDFGPGRTVNLSAPLIGDYRGVLIFQDRANPNDVLIRGNFATGLDGVIYAKEARVEVQDQGGGAKNLKTEIVADRAKFTGDTTFTTPTVPVISAATGSGVRVIAWND